MNEIWSTTSDNYIDLIKAIRSEGFETQPRGLKIHELLNENLNVDYSNVLMNCPGVRDIVDPNTKEGQYLRAEFVWYMAGDLETSFISKFGKMWERLGNDFPEGCNGKNQINSNYGFQVFYKPAEGFTSQYINYPIKYSMFEWVVNEFRKDRDTRKAIIQYTWPVIYMDGVKDFTCTQTQHFLVREGELYNLVHIRSSDAIKGLTFDIPWWDFVGQYLARRLEVNYSKMRVNIGSSHIYSSDDEVIDKILAADSIDKFRFTSLNLKNRDDSFARFMDILSEFKKLNYYRDSKAIQNLWLKIDKRVLDPVYTCMELCKYYISMDFPNMNRDWMLKINNMIFDSMFTY